MNTEMRNALVIDHMHIVTTIARQFYIAPSFYEDIIQEGNIGLIVAAEHYNPNAGVTFSSYASWWVRRYIGRAILDFSQIVRLPQRGTANPIYTEPLNKIIAYDEGEPLTYEDILTDVGTADQAILRQQEEDDFAERLSRLTTREWEILSLRYGLNGEPLSTPEIARQFEISTRMVQMILQQSIKKMQI